LNSILSYIPIYWMSVYRLPIHVRHSIDKLRKYFYGMVTILLRKKILLVVWKIVCRSKQQCGLGLLDLEMMNTTLLAK
jgi:hypothetical protein